MNQVGNMSYYGVFDGHGGQTCAQWLADNLHLVIMDQKTFPKMPEKALFDAFKEAEKQFQRQNL